MMSGNTRYVLASTGSVSSSSQRRSRCGARKG